MIDRGCAIVKGSPGCASVYSTLGGCIHEANHPIRHAIRTLVGALSANQLSTDQ